MSKSETQESLDDIQKNDEITIHDLKVFARRHYVAALGGAIAGSVLGLVVAHSLPAQFQANVLLQMAQLGGGGAVEPTLKVVERISLKSFLDDARVRMTITSDEANPKEEFCTVKAKIAKTELINVIVRGSSPDQAARCLNAVVAELAVTHTKMSEPVLNRWRAEIHDIDAELKVGEAELKWVKGLLEAPTRGLQVAKSYQVALASMLLTRGTELRALRDRKRTLLEKLSPDRTFATAPFGRGNVLQDAVFPNKPLFAGGGLMIGLLIGMLLSVLFGHRKRPTD